MRAKRRGWRGRLAATIERYRRRPFDWDGSHCTFFAADCVEAMTGVDLAEPYRGKTLSEQKAALATAGFADHVEMAAAQLGEEVHPSRAVPGDIAVIDAEFGPSLGVVIGAEIAVYAPRGIENVKLMRAQRVFQVP